MRFAIPLSILAAALVAGATSGAATAADKAADKAAKPARACFRADDVRNWKFYDHQRHVNITTDRKGVFTGEVIGICPSADFAQTLGIKSRLSSFICEGDFADLFVRDAGGPQRCEMQNIRQMSTAEVAALPKEQKP